MGGEARGFAARQVGRFINGIEKGFGFGRLGYLLSVRGLFIYYGGRIGRERLKEFRFGGEVIFGCFVIVEVVAREVCEGGGLEVDGGEAALVEGVRACLDNHRFCAGLKHLGLCLCDGQGVRGRKVCGLDFFAGIVNDGPDEAAFLASGLEAGADEEGDGGLAVGARDGEVG